MKEIIEKQERYLQEIIDQIESAPQKKQRDLDHLWQSMQKLKEDIQTANEHDLSALYYELNNQQSLYIQMSKAELYPDASSPYFAYMRYLDGKVAKEVFLGHLGYSIPGRDYKIIDWKNAPVAQIFYHYNQGEEFEVDLPGRSVEGVLLDKLVLTIEQGKLIRIDCGDQAYLKVDQQWVSKKQLEIKLTGGEGTALSENTFGVGLSEFSSPQVASLLDKHQYQVVNNCSRDPLLVVGGAGSGKTTVALHRIATLCQRRIVPIDSILVIVPHIGLVELSRRLLAEIGLSRVKVRTNDEWMHEQIYALYPQLSAKICPSTPLSVSMVKRHGSMMALIDLWIETQRQTLLDVIRTIDHPSKELEKEFQALAHLPLIPLLEKLYSTAGLTTIQKIELKKAWEELNEIEEDRVNLLYSKSMLLKLKELSNGVITERMIDDTVRHTFYQMQEVEESTDKQAVDGKSLEDGTILEYYGSIDQEDWPILLYLQLKKCGKLETPFGSIKKVHHLVLDEAQELSPLEQVIFSHLVHGFGSVTIAGDGAQQIDPTISFSGWEDLLKRMGFADRQVVELNISYRSPQSVMDYAQKLLGLLAAVKPLKCAKQGAPVMTSSAQHAAHASMQIFDQLSDLLLREPKATVAVICNKMTTARDLYLELRELGKVRLVEHCDFSFKPGVDVTTVDQIRGLEFDYVIIPDADVSNYPQSSVSRKRLHLAATRAIHQLWVVCPGVASPILP